MTGGFSEAKDSQAAKVQEEWGGGGGGVIQSSLSDSQIKRSNYSGESFMGASCTEDNFPGVQLFRDNSLGQKPLGIIQRKMCLSNVKNPGSNCPGRFHGGQLPGRTIQE